VSNERAELEELVTVSFACRALGVQDRTLRGWLSAGAIPCVRLSRRCIRIKLSDLRSFIASRSVPARGAR